MESQNLKSQWPHRKGKQNNFLMHLFVGGSDGIVLMVFITTLLASAGMGRTPLINISLVILLFTGLIMGLSGYLASLVEKKHFKTVREETAQLDEIRKETILLDNLGINKNLQLIAFEEMEKDRQHWARLMGATKLGLPPTSTPSNINGAETGLSYTLGGMLPLLPYLFSKNDSILGTALIFSMTGLIIFGYFKSFYTQTKPLISIGGSLIAGILAGTGAYVISKIFILTIYIIPVIY